MGLVLCRSFPCTSLTLHVEKENTWDLGSVVAVLSGVGMHEVRMFNPLRPGDTLFVDAWWTELRRSVSKPDRGFAAIRCKVINQKKEPIVEYGYRYLLACGDFEFG